MNIKYILAGGITLGLFFAATTQAQVTEATLNSISIADKVETNFGTLEFFDGVPSDATIDKLYDNLDRVRAVGVYLDNMGGVSINSVLDGLAKAGADAPSKIAVFEQLMDSQTLVVTANTSTLYDTQTRSQLQTSQKFPTVGSLSDGMKKNADGSYDIYFGPKAPKGKEGNWLATVPGKSWFTILRMYGPLKPWIDKTWRPGEIELVK